MSNNLGALARVTALLIAATFLGCGSAGAPVFGLDSIGFETTAVPGGGAGQLYNVLVELAADGEAAMPEKFFVESGVLPMGVRLVADRVDADLDGLPDPGEALTGHARLIGFPRETGSFQFTLKAVSTGGTANPDQPDLVALQGFTLTIGEGRVTIVSPTAAEGTTDPALPAFPSVIPFVNPANPQGFYSFTWQVAGGSNANVSTVYMPRELELSIFDTLAADLSEDTDEAPTTGNKFETDFSDGGWFALQLGNDRVQVGGFQSPRGVVGTITNLDPDWFQPDGAEESSRRDLGDSDQLGDDDSTLGTDDPIVFADYFDSSYVDTDPNASPRAKYPFKASQYFNAFFLPFTEGVDVTPLRFRIIVESIDTHNTPLVKTDDVIARKAYVVQVQIPSIRFETFVLPEGTAGVDYNEFVAASGGVPPLSFELEYVDETPGDGATLASELEMAEVGLAMDPDTGQFFGVPRVSGDVDVTVRVYAARMNPDQSSAGKIPTGGDFEFDGTIIPGGKPGRHRTFALDVNLPEPLMVVNDKLAAGTDGDDYPGDRLFGTGGVATLRPDPVGFAGTYPTATALRNYGFSASYVRDASYGDDADTVDPDRELPNMLELDGDPQSTTNGTISGIAYDRGFHEVTVEITDAYLGDATAPDPGEARTVPKTLALSIGPDKAVYMRGVQSGEGAGEPTGLLDASAAMTEPRMVPMFLEAGLFEAGSGGAPSLFAGSTLPATIDLLPVMLTNGGSDEHIEKQQPSVSGFWPAESNKLASFFYYFYGQADQAWKHLQQETTWIQTPTPDHRRIYLWGETKIKRYSSSSTTHANYKRYQQFDLTGKRGVLIQNPVTGEFWVPAIVDNAKDDVDGATFGAEYVLDCAGLSPTNSIFGYVYAGGERYYHYASHMSGTREARLQGLGSYLEAGSSAYNGIAPQGRTAISVAASADGIWAATVLPGGNTQKLLLWRTDRSPIPTAILNRANVTPVDGVDVDGSALTGNAARACVVDLGGQVAGSKLIASNPRYLLPDSLMFVRDGLLFLMEQHLDYVFGMSLVDGHLSSKHVNTRSTPNGFGRSANSVRGMYIPDQDVFRGVNGGQGSMVQFAFVGNRPAAGEEGPDKVAFIAGDNLRFFAFNDYNSTYTNLSSDFSGNMRRGYAVSGNRQKSLLFLETSTGATGLDLDDSTLKDLTGSDSRIHGDLLPPGRPGEELDFMAVSPDGKYVAVVRDYYSDGPLQSTYYGLNPTFHTATTSTTTGTSYYRTSDDLLLISTEDEDLDDQSGHQSVLFLGTGNNSQSFSGTPSANGATYAGAAPRLNAAGRRICGLTFSEDGETLLFRYSGDDSYNPKYFGSAYQYMINMSTTAPITHSTIYSAAATVSIRFHFRDKSGDPKIDFTSSSAAANFLKNNLAGLQSSGVSGFGPSSGTFTNTSARFSGGTQQQFFSTFKSPNGKFLYMVSDQINGRNYLVGFNISNDEINGHKTYEGFTHDPGVGFEQWDCNAWNYSNRMAAVPGGVTDPASGRDGAGIVFIIGSDASAGTASATDLEVYVFDANIGGDLIPLTSDVTDGTSNAINHLAVSADGNILVGQRAKTTSNSGNSRAILNSRNDLFAVTNVHAVLAGAAPNAFFVSEGMSHGSTVAFIGEGKGPQALVFSSGDSGNDNRTWDERTLKIAVLQPGATFEVLDGTRSHYVVLSGGRKTDDIATNEN